MKRFVKRFWPSSEDSNIDQDHIFNHEWKGEGLIVDWFQTADINALRRFCREHDGRLLRKQIQGEDFVRITGPWEGGFELFAEKLRPHLKPNTFLRLTVVDCVGTGTERSFIKKQYIYVLGEVHFYGW